MTGDGAGPQALEDGKREPMPWVVGQGDDLLGPGAHQSDLVVIERQAVEEEGDEDEGRVGHAKERQTPHNPQAFPV